MAVGAPSLRLPGVKDALPSSSGSQLSGLLKTNTGPGSTGQQSIRMSPFRAAGAPSAPKLSGAGSLKSPAGPKTSVGGSKLPLGSTPGADPLSGLGTSNFGLNVNAKGAYNPFPTNLTQGQVNQMILAQARQQYLPQLQTIQGNTAAENAANTQRVAALRGIYNTYGSQAQQAFNQTKSALTNMLQQNAAGNAQAQGTLGAALSSANVPGSTLDQMMGITAAPGSAPSPYLAAAEAQGTGTQNELAQIAASTLGVSGDLMSNAALERSQQLDTESQRHRAAIQGLQGQGAALAQQIPTDITNARTAVTKQLQDARTTALQNWIARQSFNLTKQGQAFNEGQARQAQTFNEKQTGITNAQNWAKIAQGNRQLDQNEQSIQNSVKSTNNTTLEKVAGLQAKQAANASKLISGYITPTKQDYYTVTTPNASGLGSTKQTKVHEGTYLAHLDPNTLFQQLQGQTGLSEEQALRAMTGITTKFGTQPNLTMGQWAQDELYWRGYTGQMPGNVRTNRQSALRNLLTTGITQARPGGGGQSPQFTPAYNAAAAALSRSPAAWNAAMERLRQAAAAGGITRSNWVNPK